MTNRAGLSPRTLMTVGVTGHRLQRLGIENVAAVGEAGGILEGDENGFDRRFHRADILDAQALQPVPGDPN
ncbi:MAG: hypothetical protein EOP67_21360, partial [Sphingomonas sp.]